MKFSHIGSAIIFGAAVSAQNALVYDISARQQPYGEVVLGDSLLYFADVLGVSNYYSIGEDETTFNFLAHVHKDASNAKLPPLVVVVNGAADPAALFPTAKPTFEIDLGDKQKQAPTLVKTLFDKFPGYMSENVASAKVSEFEEWRQGAHVAPADEVDVARGAQHALGLSAGQMRGNVVRGQAEKLQALISAGFDVRVVHAADSLGVVAKGSDAGASKGLAAAIEAATTAFDVTVLVTSSEDKLCHHSATKRSYAAPFAKRGVVSAKSCYADEETCQSSTNDCSNHGSCVKVQTDCWQCACAPSYDKKAGRTTKWAGADCSKKDLSAPAHLLLWTSVVLVGTLAVGVKLLFSVGSESLPGVLEAATVKRSA